MRPTRSRRCSSARWFVPGRYPERVDHYRVLRTIEDIYGLRPTGNAAHVAPLTDIWK